MLGLSLHRWETAMPKKLSADQEIIAAHMASTTAAFQVLVRCLEQNGSLEPGQYPLALHAYMEAARERAGDMTLALLDDLRRALMH